MAEPWSHNTIGNLMVVYQKHDFVLRLGRLYRGQVTFFGLNEILQKLIFRLRGAFKFMPHFSFNITNNYTCK
jgi:hypothetical protein